MANDHFYLYLEPYVHMAEGRSSVLFYNTVSRKAVEFKHSPIIDQLISQLRDPENGYVALLPEAEHAKYPELARFTGSLQENFMADIWKPGWSESRPFNLVPLLAVKHSLPAREKSVDPLLSAIELKDYLKELIICLNYSTGSLNSDLCLGFSQFSFPAPLLLSDQEFPFSLLQHMVGEGNSVKFPQLTFTGSDILGYTAWEDLMRLMRRTRNTKRFYLDYRGAHSGKMKDIAGMQGSMLDIHVTFPVEMDSWRKMLRYLPGGNKKTTFRMIVKSEAELGIAERFIQQQNLTSFSFHPFYDGNNLPFFEQCVFMTRDEILAGKPDQKQVLSRLSVNELDLGILHILPSGTVHANPLDPSLGNISDHSLQEIIIRELRSGKSWTRTRKSVSPCKDCIFHFLCPPVSRYEIFLKKFNLCDVFRHPPNL